MENYVSGADVTRRALIEAALKLFGDRGYEAVSTREIADHAAANIGSIAYHFGGKPGLRRAAAAHVVSTMTSMAGPGLHKPLPKMSPNEAMGALEQLTHPFIQFLVGGSEGRLFLNFMLREIMQPGEILDHVYAEMFKPVHTRFCQIVGMATGLDPESEEMRILVFSIIGQGIYFHIGRPIVLKRLEWDDIGPAQAEKIRAVLIKNLRTIILANRRIS